MSANCSQAAIARRVASVALYFSGLFILFCGCTLGGTSLKVTITNDSPSALTLLEVGGVVRLDQVSILEPNGMKTLRSDRLGYTTFQVQYLGVIYEGNSGNSDDYSEYQIVFDETFGSLSCRLIVPGYGDMAIPLSVVDSK